MIEIDLTKYNLAEDSNEENVSGEQDVDIDIDVSEHSNEDSFQKSDGLLLLHVTRLFLQGAICICFISQGTTLTVKNVLDEKFRSSDKSGEEFICRFCHDNLKSWNNPKYPIKCVYLAQSKNQGPVVLNGDEVKIARKKKTKRINR